MIPHWKTHRTDRTGTPQPMPFLKQLLVMWNRL